ncbi:zeta toxin family protein [Pseudomonas parafulva]|uniref:Zeta toxin family protein n=1 Tax=Pseudomonas parafulva TaxID=157782 RepID=A0AAI8KE34_9PSED|nr:zeta toxin family protein [Pseudomonas parafulva]AXO90101.1 zeta toxin family protein [Pseudomonas parafulva]
MSHPYPYTEAELQAVFEAVSATLFDKTRDVASDGQPEPKLLIVAGAQGSGKTYLLENHLLPGNAYDNYVRLYVPAYRALHPRYEQMRALSGLEVYAQTEPFIWALGNKLFSYAFQNRYNIIMESALDSADFASFPATAVALGYRFEVHLIACQKEFSHWATLHRGVKAVAKDEFERFVPLSKIETSQGNARAILDAFENACTQAPGSEITLYHRGFETGMESQALCHSRCEAPAALTPQPDFKGQPFVTAPQLNPHFQIIRSEQANFPCSYVQYSQVVHAGMVDAPARQQMVQHCCQTLEKAQALMPAIPQSVFRELSVYVLKYAYA